MRQIGAENHDPLKRIQAEINEVEQREREHREKLATATKMLSQSHDGDFVDDAGIDPSMSPISDGHSSLSSTPDKDPCSDSVSAFSDDSGISSASSPINGQSANEIDPPKNMSNINSPSKYIRLNTVQNAISASPFKANTTSGVASKIISRTTSTPQIFVPGITPRFQINPAKKGLMQRFISTRGKMAAAANAANAANSINNNNDNNITKNGVGAMETTQKQNGFANKRNDAILTSLELNRTPFMLQQDSSSPPIIERDATGKPIRRGFIPVEEKIQKELRDIRSRETELKRMRRNQLLQSQPDLLDCVDQGVDCDSTGEDSDDEPCYKLRSSKSISELCDALTQNTSLSPRESPSPLYYQREMSRSVLKPAVSLAQLCDVDPSETPSSHRLIAQWESIIQKNQ
ncbi:uncharacterized protein LOC129574595 [Sitodiplosis mosellana]|uniref:uncharacterized protein LOC129574595 n=1 Tax=Sitodiplosis mosellana TaxID=263140 RepID=UPI00244459C1|nr:uncharacterized protein LOC129574595 [Sitodiplosis mosellana]XP_055312777.1 uncharacterized protein LOC129574595 [Sitodiplosis mosellana]XP_055312787.1 uncharacterized protein LOC129574595 [Sitodiplosis mosellana]